MYGQLKSRVICKDCRYESNTFDPFLALSLPIPSDTMSRMKVVYYPQKLGPESAV